MYGHTKSYCNHHPRCVGCGQDHLSEKCVKPKEMPAICANCNGPHPSNYRGCQTLKELRMQRRGPVQQRIGPQQTTSHTTSENQTTSQPKPVVKYPRCPPLSVEEYPALPGTCNQPKTSVQWPKGMMGGRPQGEPHTSFTNTLTPQISQIVVGMQQAIQPLIHLLTQLSQLTQALCQSYDK